MLSSDEFDKFDRSAAKKMRHQILALKGFATPRGKQLRLTQFLECYRELDEDAQLDIALMLSRAGLAAGVGGELLFTQIEKDILPLSRSLR